jgi:alkanesulfonate monooxygenase SsuD/methylene tetrahydromethanopterin reductase-like flavin-dependent oxidoreductase (luciferase family)
VGVHTPLQHTDVGSLLALWRAVDDEPVYDWISVWDHMAGLDGTTQHFEAVAMHAALACHTRRVRCACLVYAAGYRAPLLLAEAVSTIDHLSGGRAVLGIGAGYVESEHAALGVTLGPPADRIARLRQTVTAVRSLLDGEEVTVDGTHVRLDRARCAPLPVQQRLPIVVGGGGERSTIPLAARLADGWNVPMCAPDDLARKVALLRGHQDLADRDVAEVEASASVGLCFDGARIPERFGARHEVLRPAILHGSDEQVRDQFARFRATGVDRIVLSLRPPYDAAVLDDLARFAESILPGVTP